MALCEGPDQEGSREAPGLPSRLMGNQGICRIRAFPTSRSLGSREIRGGPPDPSTSPEPAGQQRPTSYLAENTAGRACSRIAGMPRDSHPHSQSLFLNTSDTMSWYLPQAPGSAGLDTEAAPAWGWLGDTLRALAVGAQLILRVEQGRRPSHRNSKSKLERQAEAP